ncbi:unnamed protein product [Eruca vesicaria subsp. sativa]|uniref:Uncharacterized protein n=1 Tax=Eruca vesicaria subsp. sativa TaxID=29727 RepID=A0ABC8LMA5_ERUVS|nr:unnamed protein product [Eruca vesicaria subsp. sativa]
MVSLVPSQSSRLVFRFALTQSVSMDLVFSKLEKTFVVSAQVFKTIGTASVIGVSRKICTRTIFSHHDPQKGWLSLCGVSLHLLPYSEFVLHMRSRSERTSVGLSVSELRSDKAQTSAIKSTLGRRSASSSRYKRGSVSLLGGCSTPNIPFTKASSPPSCATDVLRSSSASHPGSRVSPARLVDNGPKFNCLWAWPITTNEERNLLLSQSIPSACHNESQQTMGL